jgi:hypothetical protein
VFKRGDADGADGGKAGGSNSALSHAHSLIHPILSLLYFAPVAATVLIPVFFVVEYPTMRAVNFHPKPGQVCV